MSLAIREFERVWKWNWIKTHPARFGGIQLHLLFRTLFAIFWLAAGINKVVKGWLNSDILRDIFLDRLSEMPPDAFASLFLMEFALPLHVPVAWFITWGEIYSALGLLLGFTTRLAAGVSLFILCGFAAGGYYDASLIPFFLLTIVFLWWPSGLWLGLDRPLARRYPDFGGSSRPGQPRRKFLSVFFLAATGAPRSPGGRQGAGHGTSNSRQA